MQTTSVLVQLLAKETQTNLNDDGWQSLVTNSIQILKDGNEAQSELYEISQGGGEMPSIADIEEDAAKQSITSDD